MRAVSDLYPFVLTIILVGVILGTGVLLLDKFAATSGLTANAVTAINDTVNAITPISTTWLPLVVTIAVLAIILGLVIGGFAMYRGR